MTKNKIGLPKMWAKYGTLGWHTDTTNPENINAPGYFITTEEAESMLDWMQYAANNWKQYSESIGMLEQAIEIMTGKK